MNGIHSVEGGKRESSRDDDDDQEDVERQQERRRPERSQGVGELRASVANLAESHP
jgi:hypothetical protein